MNSIRKLNDGMWLQTVQHISGISTVVLPLSGAVSIYDPIVTHGRTATRNGENFEVSADGCSIYVLCNLLKHNDDQNFYYSPSMNALYKGEFTLALPEDAITLTESEWMALCEGLNDRRIVMVNGRPQLSSYRLPVAPKDAYVTVEELLPQIKKMRAEIVSSLDGAVMRHRREIDLEIEPSLSPSEYRQLLLHIQSVCTFVSGLDKTEKVRGVEELNWPQLSENLRGKL